MKYPLNYCQSSGLLISSNIVLKHLQSGCKTGPPDVILLAGRFKEELAEEPTYSTGTHRISSYEYYFEMPQIGRFLVRQGKEIFIEPFNEIDDRILFYIYNECLPTLLLQRKIIPFHVSGVFIDQERVCLFCGQPGVGKTTTAMLLASLGYPMFTDDIASFQLTGNEVTTLTCSPTAWLRKEALKCLSNKVIPETVEKCNNLDRYAISFKSSYSPLPKGIAAIVFLQANGDEITVKPIKPINAIQKLRVNIPNKDWLSVFSIEEELFYLYSALAKTVPFWSATRPSESNTFESFANEIEEKILKQL